MPVYPNGHVLSQRLIHFMSREGMEKLFILFLLGLRKADEMSLPATEHGSGYQIAVTCLWPHKGTPKTLFPKYGFKNKLACQVAIVFLTGVHANVKLHSQGPHAFHPSRTELADIWGFLSLPPAPVTFLHCEPSSSFFISLKCTYRRRKHVWFYQLLVCVLQIQKSGSSLVPWLASW